MHRAAAASAVLVVLSGLFVAPNAEAHAAYSSKTSNGSNSWNTACGDVTPSTGATPSLYYGYGGGSGSSITDLSASADTGTFQSGVSRATCTSGWSPYASFNGTATSVVNTSRTNRPHPTAATIATWFKVNPGDAGGVLADFGNSNTAAASSWADDGLYMGDSGTLTFTAATGQALGLLIGYQYCTTSSAYADGQWHLVVATVSLTGTAGCTITVDAKPSTTVSTSFPITLSLGGYIGDWRFGYDAASSNMTNAPSRPYFKGALDETQIYDSVISPPTAAAPGVQATIYANGHGGSIN